MLNCRGVVCLQLSVASCKCLDCFRSPPSKRSSLQAVVGGASIRVPRSKEQVVHITTAEEVLWVRGQGHGLGNQAA